MANKRILDMLSERDSLLTLIESIDETYKKELGDNTAELKEAKNEDSDEDIIASMDGVNVPEDETVENIDSFDVELSDEEKNDIKKSLKTTLDEIFGEDVSGENIDGAALEMILEEMAKSSTYLSEVEEDKLDGPVEKQNYLSEKEQAVVEYMKEILGLVSEVGVEEATSTTEDEIEGLDNIDDIGSELPPTDEPVDLEKDPMAESSEVESEKKEEVEKEKEKIVEAIEEDSEKEDLEEGVCTECGDAPVVDSDDVAYVIPEEEYSKVTPVNDEEIGLNVVDDMPAVDTVDPEIDQKVEEYRQFLLSSKGVITEGTTEYAKHIPKGFQKTSAPKDPEYGELREKLDSAIKKLKAKNALQKANEAAVASSLTNGGKTTFNGKNDFKPTYTLPASSAPATTTAKKNAPSTKVEPKVAARVVSESVKPVKSSKISFLEEARKVIRGK